jgi:uncharacterized OsmC-like protein
MDTVMMEGEGKVGERTPAETGASKRPPPQPRNGVNTPALLATIEVVAGQPALGEFQFRAKSRWMGGTHTQTTMAGFMGAGGEHQHARAHEGHADHPAVLCGEDAGPTPVEWVLHALASCLMAGIANIASARGVTLDAMEASVEGDIDLRGILGLSNEVRNGYRGIRVSFDIKSDASPETIAKIVAQSQARSAVLDIITNGVPVSVQTRAGASR